LSHSALIGNFTLLFLLIPDPDINGKPWQMAAAGNNKTIIILVCLNGDSLAGCSCSRRGPKRSMGLINRYPEPVFGLGTGLRLTCYIGLKDTPHPEARQRGTQLREIFTGGAQGESKIYVQDLSCSQGVMKSGTIAQQALDPHLGPAGHLPTGSLLIRIPLGQDRHYLAYQPASTGGYALGFCPGTYR
jgi:hypothetical protein